MMFFRFFFVSERAPSFAALLASFILINTQLRTVYSGFTTRIANVIHNDDGTTESVDSVHALIASLVFLTALVFNLNAAMWSLHNTRYSLNLQVAYISAVAGRVALLMKSPFPLLHRPTAFARALEIIPSSPPFFGEGWGLRAHLNLRVNEIQYGECALRRRE